MQDEARSQTTSLGERLKELQTSQERSAAQLLQLQAALKDCVEGERPRGTMGRNHLSVQGDTEEQKQNKTDNITVLISMTNLSERNDTYEILNNK